MKKILFLILFLVIGIGLVSAAKAYDNEIYTKSKIENVEISPGKYESHYFIFIHPWGYNKADTKGLWEDVGVYNKSLDRDIPDKEFKSLKANDRLYRFKSRIKSIRFAVFG